jgi:streptomycin 3"-adenylyltransferase
VTASLPPRSSIDHTPARAQHWSNVDADVGNWLDELIRHVEQTLPEVSGVYLHGSLAMGSYYRPKSDVDVLVIVDGKLTGGIRRALAVRVLEAFDARPTSGGIELSAVRRREVQRFQHTARFELHFSERWAEEVRSGGSGPSGTDPDLAAHCTVTRARGVALRGEDPAIAIAPVPRGAFMEAIIDDFNWIVDGGIQESPFYGVLNVCRVLKIFNGVDERSPPSKDEAGEWALEHLPQEHRPTVRDALDCYRAGADIAAEHRRVHGHAWDVGALTAFAAFARQAIAFGD